MKNINEIENNYKIKTKKIIQTYEDGYIGKKTYEVTLNNGKSKKIEQITKNKGNGDAVVIIPITKSNKFVIILESRPNTKEEVIFEFPAGMVDYGETFKEAAKRELEEETGYTSNKLIELEWYYQDQGCSSAIVKIFIATDCKRIKEQSLDESECIDYFELTYNELEKLIENNKIVDVNSKMAFTSYTLKKRKGSIKNEI